MPFLAAPVADDRDAIRQFLVLHQRAFLAVGFGLTDEQARSTPSASALSVGGLIKHAADVQHGWLQRVLAAPGVPEPDDRPFDERAAEFQDAFRMREDETLAELMDALRSQNAATLRALDELDLDVAVPVPRDAPWFPADVEHWTVRSVFHHINGELARHAGHADIIRESVDGATLYELVAAAENEPETDWLQPWRPAT